MNILSYKWWWLRIGGRKWTYLIRDYRVEHPTQWMLGVMVVSATIGHYFWSWWLLVFFGILLIGILWGHLWWGTKHIPGQGLDDSNMAPGDRLSDYQEQEKTP